MAGYPGESGRPGQQDEEDGAQHQGPVIRDKRRIDPETGELRQPAQPAAADPTIPDDLSGLEELAGLAEADRGGDAALAAERLADLQRLQAEYVNYRKRVERDRDVARDQAVGGVLEALLPVLDDIHLARQHGDLDGGPFAAIADKLDSVLNRYGLQRFGEAGEPFDPAVHEALMHTQADLGEGVDVTTVTQVLQPGYRQGDRVLRAARVAVADPE
jgi:molecular chaperone GrpE